VWHKVGDLETLSDEKILEVLNTNLVAQILITRGLLLKLKESVEGAIINIISKSGIVAQAGQSVYTASKYGMRGFTDVLRQDLKESSIRVGAVFQSGTNTQMFAKAGDEFAVETFTEPKDLAEVVAFMLSRPEKLWINEVMVEK
jgi:NADP-dependent 3-hydroxy acid dehydrogenase YdfG